MRIGHGYDVHRLVEGRKLILCGVEIPYKKGLMGHSDADAAFHAAADAILGALGKGDIGSYFPDTDPRYEGADSGNILSQVAGMAEADGYRVGNIDITVIAQAPRMLPYIPRMKTRTAQILQVGESQVNVKATTEERLGFTGNGEGIACHAVALLFPR